MNVCLASGRVCWGCFECLLRCAPSEPGLGWAVGNPFQPVSWGALGVQEGGGGGGGDIPKFQRRPGADAGLALGGPAARVAAGSRRPPDSRTARSRGADCLRPRREYGLPTLFPESC